MTTGKKQTSRKSNEVTPANEPAATPLISAAEPQRSTFHVQRISEHRFYPLMGKAEQIAINRGDSVENWRKGLLGEDALAHYLGIEDQLDTEIYECGDGGIDLEFRGATIDVKTVGRHRCDPALTVDAYQELIADYYVLASRIGRKSCRLIGYAPRQFVANAPIRTHQGNDYHHVDQEYLFPFPQKPVL